MEVAWEREGRGERRPPEPGGGAQLLGTPVVDQVLADTADDDEEERTRGGRERFFFPDRAEAIAMFERAGFIVEVVEMPRRPYTDVVYLARKAPARGPIAP